MHLHLPICFGVGPDHRRFQVQGALRAGTDANPPLNMHQAIMFNGVFIFVSSFLVLFLKGDMVRKARDEERNQEINVTSMNALNMLV